MTQSIEQLISAVETADSAISLLQAVRALAETKDELAIPLLIKVLGYNNPGAAVASVEGLIACGKKAIPYLLEQLDGYNYGARAWAIRACSGIGDPRALPLLKKATLEDFSLSVRRSGAKGLGTILWEDIPLEDRYNVQVSVFETLQQSVVDSEWVVRYSSVVGLESLALNAVDSALKKQIIEHCEKQVNQENELAVKSRLKLLIHRLSS